MRLACVFFAIIVAISVVYVAIRLLLAAVIFYADLYKRNSTRK